MQLPGRGVDQEEDALRLLRLRHQAGPRHLQVRRSPGSPHPLLFSSSQPSQGRAPEMLISSRVQMVHHGSAIVTCVIVICQDSLSHDHSKERPGPAGVGRVRDVPQGPPRQAQDQVLRQIDAAFYPPPCIPFLLPQPASPTNVPACGACPNSRCSQCPTSPFHLIGLSLHPILL